jgi:hypothetical protein
MQQLKTRIARQLAKFRRSNTRPDYEEQARIILQIVNQERLAEIHKWREQRIAGSHTTKSEVRTGLSRQGHGG